MTTAVIEFDRAAAERRAERIQLRLDAIADNYAAVMPMIREAIEKRDDIALGYNGVSAYISDRFGHALQRLGVQVRREVHQELEAAGLSVRAIASVTGVSRETARRDLAGDTRVSPGDGAIDAEVEEDFITDQADLDAATTEEPPAEVRAREAQTTDAGEAVTGAAVEQTPEPSPAPARPVTGLDGKTYTRREPAKPKRRPLIDAFGEKRWDVQKAVESLHRLTQDDRFTPNAEKVATANRSDLLRTRDLLTQVIESLPEIY